ncbi:N-formylglutamate amidohydrolase [Fibrobacter sp. UWEL]|uniref:N-formylglutamate amidohydrolase n=1 Tax=Fibrobacter sp. UWEL TaxID=1896209 RepID=UPI00090F263D|nr:N-formylglutamate amidohydrolase [Fibrobacter sp. UWEL]SHL08320.1 Predicted N-formylglutamate amidohydrolase [Fibrobacter sp. UWEL]
MSQNDFKLMITCEHASNELPARVKDLRISQEDLDSHRGYDIGAFAVYEELVSKFKPDFYSSGRYSRLFVDLNRSLRNNKFASPAGIAYHESYWGEVEKFVVQNLPEISEDPSKAGCVLPAIVHLAIHSFTPILDGRTRKADIGILYDPSRPAEREIADIIVAEIRVRFPQYKVRRNYPYQGKTDGLCTALRKKFDPHKTGCYVGLEIEINQKLLLR